MKKQLLSFAFLFISLALKAQLIPMFTFDYDGAGNRISRMYIGPPRLANPNNGVSDSLDNKGYSQNINGMSVTVFPNPTGGKMNIEIKNYSQEQNALTEVYDCNGKLIQTIPISESSTNVDITETKPGYYILRVTLNRKYKEWKILKM